MIELIDLLENATPDERRLLSQILDCSDQAPAALAARLQRRSASFFAWHVRKKRSSYRDIVIRVSKQVGIKNTRRSTADLERAITVKLWASVLERMTPEERSEYSRKLTDAAKQTKRFDNLTGLAILTTGMVTANASGFGIYLLASSTLGALTSSLGFALPFGAYMGMSSLMSVVLGPVGFLGLGLLAIHKITGPDHTRIATAVVAACAIRNRIEDERLAVPRSRVQSRPGVLAGCALIAMVLLVYFWIHSTSGPSPIRTLASRPVLQAADGFPATRAPERIVRIGNAAFHLVSASGDTLARLTVKEQGKTVRTIESALFTYSQNLCGRPGWPNPGDLDGDGYPELVIKDYSGGAHCCTTWHVFRVRGSNVNEYLTISNNHLDACPFVDIDGDGRPEVQIADASFAYWKASFAESAIPLLTYRLKPAGLTFAPDLMRKELPTREELGAWSKGISWEGYNSSEPPPVLTSHLLGLIEGGQANSIVSFLNLAWPPEITGRSVFMQAFERQMQSSEHWREWDTLNGGLTSFLDEAATDREPEAAPTVDDGK